MTTKELINSEIENLSEDELKKVYGVVRNLAESKASGQRPSFMSRLKRIQIDAPEDFASNLDLYVSGEKSAQFGNEAIRLAEDSDDLKAFQSRAKEPNLDFNNVMRSLKRRGKI